MKFYHVETQEDYDALMKELDEKGYYWSNYDGLFDTNEWLTHKSETVVDAHDNKKELSYANKEYFQSRYPNEEIITYKATKKEKILGISTDPVNKPNHYVGIQGLEVETVLQNFIPRYTDSYEAHRIASAIEYLLRSPLKNGTEDVEKAKKNIEQVLSYRETLNE